MKQLNNRDAAMSTHLVRDFRDNPYPIDYIECKGRTEAVGAGSAREKDLA
jgi:hypothetical protein